jgi:polysaccharide export outer membrane protein
MLFLMQNSSRIWARLVLLAIPIWIIQSTPTQASDPIRLNSGSSVQQSLVTLELQETSSLNKYDELSDTAGPQEEIFSSSMEVAQAENTDNINSFYLASDYILGPGDQIETRIVGYEVFDWSLTNRFVLSDGNIHLPFVGTIPAAGKTLTELESELTRQLSQYIKFPLVNISLTRLRPVIVNVAGEVYRPGPVQLGSLTQSETSISSGGAVSTSTTTPNLAAALTAAGGIQRTADIRYIRITRRSSNGSHQEFTVDLWQAIQGNTDPGVLVLFDGDTVFVPEAVATANLDQRLLSSSSIAPAFVRVRVIGEVRNPGEVQLQPNSSVSSAIAAAGGPDSLTAQLSDVKLIRLLPSGQIDEQTLDLASLVDDYQIQDGDVVLVPKKGYLSTVDGISRVLSPLLAPLDILNIFNLF